MRRLRPWTKRCYSAVAAVATLLAWATPALAHGGLSGSQDVLSHYGVLVFLLAVVIVGAGVVAWVTLSPEPDEEDDDLLLADERAAPERAEDREAAHTRQGSGRGP